MHFNELRIYQISIKLEKEIYEIIQTIPYNWTIEQVDQIKRSSSSISSNIVEGWNRRFYPKDFIRFLSIALGSSDETQHHIRVLYNKSCVDQNFYDKYAKEYKNLSIKILNFINCLRRKYNIIYPA